MDKEESLKKLMSTAEAAQFLSELLPEKDSRQWTFFLRNNRKASRSKPSYRIPFQRATSHGTGAFYESGELEKFAEHENRRVLMELDAIGNAVKLAASDPLGFRISGQLSDEDLKRVLSESQMDEGEVDCVGFVVKTGTDSEGRVFYVIENGVKGFPHVAIATPFTPEQWLRALEGNNQ